MVPKLLLMFSKVNIDIYYSEQPFELLRTVLQVTQNNSIALFRFYVHNLCQISVNLICVYCKFWTILTWIVMIWKNNFMNLT